MADLRNALKTSGEDKSPEVLEQAPVTQPEFATTWYFRSYKPVLAGLLNLNPPHRICFTNYCFVTQNELEAEYVRESFVSRGYAKEFTEKEFFNSISLELPSE